VTYRDCPECAGRGYQPAASNWATLEPCDHCGGSGRIEASPPVGATVPAGPGFVVFSLVDATPLGALEETLRGRELPSVYAN
jgi:hypothetical protein